MSRPVNIKKIRVGSFSIECSETLNYGDSAVIGMTGEVTDIHGTDNHDGTQNLTYTIKPVIVQIDSVIEGEKKTLASTETAGKSRSKQLRAKAYRIAQQTGESSEALYESAIDEASQWLDNHESTIIMKELT
jgi:hypothetical protein